MTADCYRHGKYDAGDPPFRPCPKCLEERPLKPGHDMATHPNGPRAQAGRSLLETFNADGRVDNAMTEIHEAVEERLDVVADEQAPAPTDEQWDLLKRFADATVPVVTRGTLSHEEDEL